MKRHFVDLLACPRCSAELTLTDAVEQTGEIESGRLACAQGHGFPVLRGIPRFVEDEHYASNFGFEWNRFNRTQLDSDVSNESEEAFRVKTGLTPSDIKGKLVLDVGCGMGRFSDVVSRWGGQVVGIDLSLAVDAAYRNIGRRAEVQIAQANVFELPFRPETFDVIFSIGVLHHTPDTRAAFEQLPRLLKPGGKIAIWVYTRYDSIPSYMSDIWRKLTTRMPQRLLYGLSHAAIVTAPLYRMPRLGLLPRKFFPASSHPKAEWRVLDTFDWYSPRYQWKHTYEEVWPWFEAQGLVDIKLTGFPVALQGTKPPAPARRDPAPDPERPEPRVRGRRRTPTTSAAERAAPAPPR
jgi:SAM-dependent methyltransferase